MRIKISEKIEVSLSVISAIIIDFGVNEIMKKYLNGLKNCKKKSDDIIIIDIIVS
jgi:hypothetical protein